jgi:hypothetical protein
VSIWGIIPYEAGAMASSSGNHAIILNNNDCPMAGSVKELAQRIIAAEITKDSVSRSVVKRT